MDLPISPFIAPLTQKPLPSLPPGPPGCGRWQWRADRAEQSAGLLAPDSEEQEQAATPSTLLLLSRARAVAARLDLYGIWTAMTTPDTRDHDKERGRVLVLL